MIVNKAYVFSFIAILLTIKLNKAHSVTVKDIFKPNADTSDLLAIVRVARDAHSVVRKVRDSKYYEQNYKDVERGDRSLKPEDNAEDDRDSKTSTTLGKRCTTCDTGYLRPSYDRGRDRDPYSYSSRSRYDPYDRYDRYNDDYDRDGYNSRGRTRYSTSSYDRYDPRDRYYDRGGSGYENRGYDYYSPYSSRDRGYDAYSPYDDYYSRGYESSSSRGSYGSRPEYSGGYGGNGYARGYSYGGDRDRYGGYGGYGSGYGGYGSGYGGYGSGYGSGSRSRYPSYDYDSGYRSTSYLYGRPSSTTTDNPKSPDSDHGNTASPVQGSSAGRSK